jgi:hypothetical protein
LEPLIASDDFACCGLSPRATFLSKAASQM